MNEMIKEAFILVFGTPTVSIFITAVVIFVVSLVAALQTINSWGR
jgi:hypothetical protein